MNELVTVRNGEVYTDSLIIAEGTQNKHKSIYQTISDYAEHFNELGTLSFLKRESTGGRPEQYYELNEPQAAFLMTLLRNSPIVVSFKLELVRQFYQMRQILRENSQPPSLPDSNLLSLLASQEHRIAALEQRLIAGDTLTLPPPPQTPVYAPVPPPIQQKQAQPKARMRTQAEVMTYIKEKDPNTALTPWALRKLVLTGQVPFVQVGRKRLIDLDTLDQFLTAAMGPEPDINANTNTGYGVIRPVAIGK